MGKINKNKEINNKISNVKKKWTEIKEIIAEIKFNFKMLAVDSLENRKINNKEILATKRINLKLKAENSDLMMQLQNSKKLCDEITLKSETTKTSLQIAAEELKAENSDLMTQLQNSKKLCDEITLKNEKMVATYKTEILTLTEKVIELEQENKDKKNKINELQTRIEKNKKLVTKLHVAKATNETDLQKQIAQLEQENQAKSIVIEAKLMSTEFWKNKYEKKFLESELETASELQPDWTSEFKQNLVIKKILLALNKIHN